MADYDKFIKQSIRILDLAEVNLMEISEADRDRTLALEFEITEAANSGDTDSFFCLLDAWRCTLMRGGDVASLNQREAA